MIVSIIIPCRNEVRYIKDAINSCLNQKNIDLEGIEIIVVDGDSNDGTKEKVRLMLQGNQIKLVHNQFIYMPHGFNIALSQALGKYIMVMSGHSTLEKDYVSNSIKAITKYDAQCVSGTIETIQENFIGKIISISQSSLFGVGNSTFRINSKKGRYVETGVFGFYDSKVFLEIGGMDEELIKNQDDEFNFRLVQSGGKIWFDPTIKSKYFSRTSLIYLFKQYFLYGFYKVRVFQKRKGVASSRQLVPAIFILSIIVSILLIVLTGNNIYFNIIFGIYTFTSLTFSFATLVKRKKNLFFIPILQLSYFVIHSSYGLGFILGLIYFINKWNKRDTKDSNFNKLNFAKHNS